jgi:GH15 family glucan-1,4-alpha-glucosidase
MPPPLYARLATGCFTRSSITATNLELSEQFDRDTGYTKSVSNLTWSYAAFLSAVRARS